MEDFQNDIAKCVEALKNGGLILYPTDTIWGIGCDATNPDAVEAIYKLKQRPGDKSMIVLVATKNDILKYVANPDPQLFAEIEEFKEPTTIVFDSAIGLAENLSGQDGSIAIRICNDAFCKQLIKRFGLPIVSTSANITGDPSPQNFKEIKQIIIDGVEYIAKWRQDDNRPSKPSRVIRWNKDGTTTVLRP